MSASRSEALSVLVGAEQAGTLEHIDGRLAFSYLDSYRGPDLSVSMPRDSSSAQFDDPQARPWLDGLLPDDPAARQSMGAPWSLRANDTYGLLYHHGLDLPGAVQICAPDMVERVQNQTGRLEAITESAIRARLESAAEASAPSWTLVDEKWSLGGNQAKLALRQEQGRWYRCLGSAASTVIVKPGVVSLNNQALNEHVCMSLARACGLPAAKTYYTEFDGMGAIVIERYDRIRADAGVVRVHQEDMCQALSCPPSKKYPFDGGPNSAEVLALLSKVGSASDKQVFAAGLFFNYLVGATDGHAKNYSLLHPYGSNVRLAPFYDIASTLPYERKHGAAPWRCAMTIGGENRIGWIRRGPLERFERIGGFEAGFARSLMLELAQRIPPCLEEVLRANRDVPGVTELGERLMPRIQALCSTTLLNLDRDGRSLRIDPLIAGTA